MNLSLFNRPKTEAPPPPAIGEWVVVVGDDDPDAWWRGYWYTLPLRFNVTGFIEGEYIDYGRKAGPLKRLVIRRADGSKFDAPVNKKLVAPLKKFEIGDEISITLLEHAVTELFLPYRFTVKGRKK